MGARFSCGGGAACTMTWIRSGSEGLPSPPVKGEPLVSSGACGSACASSSASLGFDSMVLRANAIGTEPKKAEKMAKAC